MRLARGVIPVLILAASAVHVPASAAPGATADVAIGGSASSPWVKAGHDLAYTVTVVNDGPDPADNVVTTVILDVDLAIVSADASQGSCTTLPVVVCQLGSIAPSHRSMIEIRSATSSTGRVESTMAVATDALDPDVANNTHAVETTIGPDAGRCDLRGTGAADRIHGDGSAEVICAGAGPDRVLGGGGRDLVFGGPGRDVLRGGAKKDRLIGGAGSDRCPASSGDRRRSCR